MEQAWPFDQPRNCAAITVSQIARDMAPVLLVTHDEDDLGWQFLPGEAVRLEDALVVAMSEVVDLDPILNDLADLPPGWRAWRRGLGHPWVREKSLPEPAPLR